MIIPVVSSDRKLFGCINTFNNLFIACEDCCNKNDRCLECFVHALPSVAVSEAGAFSFKDVD